MTAKPAAAHGNSKSKNYVTTVDNVQPAVPGLEVSATADGNYLTITNLTGKTLIVLGYENEPYLKITPHGVWQNLRAPTVYLNEDVVGVMPDDVGADESPNWQPISTASTYRFHDHRIDWGGIATPAVVKQDPRKPHLIANWAVPLLVGRTPVTITGTVRWTPSGFPAWAVVFLGVSALLIGLFIFAIALDAKRARKDEAEDSAHSPGSRPPVTPR